MAVSFCAPRYLNDNHSTGTITYERITGHTAGRGNSDEATVQRKIFAGREGRFKNLYANFSLNQSSPTGPTNTLRVNGTDGIELNIPQGATGEFENLIDEVAVVDGDLVCIELDAPSGGVANRPNKSSVWYDAANKKHCITLATSGGGSTYQTNNNVEWTSIQGLANGEQGAESFVQSVIWMNADARHARVNVTSNTGSTDNNLILKINEGNTALDVTIPGGASGFFENITDAVTIQYGDRVSWVFVTSSSGAAVNTNLNQVDITTFKGKVAHLGIGPRTTHNSGQTRYEFFGGNYYLQGTSAGQMEHPMNERVTVGFLSMHVHSNPGTGVEATVAIMNENDVTSLLMTIPLGATGQFTDFTNTERFAVGEHMSLRIITPSSGGQTGWGHCNLLVTEQPKFRIEPVSLGGTQPDGSIGMGQALCIQIGGAATVSAAPGAGALALGGLLPTIHETAGIAIIIPVPAGNFCLRGPLDIAVTDVPIAVPVGSLTFAGLTPDRVISVNRAPGAGTLVFAGPAAVRSIGVARAPGAGALVFAGQTPVRLTAEVRAPGVGALVFGGLAPLRIVGVTRAPGAGALVFTGQTPVRFVVELRSPAAGTLVFAGQAPVRSIGINRAPGAGALVFAGLAPLANVTVLRVIPVGSLVFAGLAPVPGYELHPGVGALVLAGQAPQRFVQRVVAPGAGSLVFAGQTPLRLIDKLIPIPAGSLVLAGLQVSLDFVCPAPAGALVLQGLLPIVTTGVLKQMPAGALVLAGLLPATNWSVGVPAGALVLQGQQESLGFELHPDAGALVLAGATPLRLIDDPTPVPVGALVFGGLSPTVARTLPVPVGALVFAGQLPLRLIDKTIPVPVGALVLAGLASNLFTAINRAVPVGTLLLAGQNPTLGFVCPAPAGALVFAGLVPTLVEASGALVAEPGAAALVLQGLTPTCIAGGLLQPPVGALVFGGLAPTADVTHLRTPAAGTLVLAGQLYSLPPSAGVPVGALVFAGLAPRAINPIVAIPAAADLRFTGHALDIPTSQSRQMLPGPMAFGGQTPILDFEFHPAAHALVFTGQVLSLTQLNVSAPGELVFVGHAPTVLDSSPTPGPGTGIPTGACVLAGLAPTITAGGVVGGDVTTAMPVGACAMTGHLMRVSVFTADPMNPPNKQTLCIRRERQGTFIVDELGWLFTHMIQLDLETGIGLDGLASLQGHDPQIEMQFSDDNARTWSAIQSRSGGKVGKFRTRVIWRRLGRSRKRLYRIRLCDPVKWAIVDCYARFTKGTS